MSTLSEFVSEAKTHRVYVKNRKGKPFIDISLLLAVILAVAAPELVLALLIGVMLEILDVEYDNKPVSLGS